MILLDLCTALLASRVTLIHVVGVLQAAGHEVSVWSALDRKCSREALIAAGVLEVFDDVYHMDAMLQMDDFAALRDAAWISLEQLMKPAQVLRTHGVGEARMPTWLGWLG